LSAEQSSRGCRNRIPQFVAPQKLSAERAFGRRRNVAWLRSLAPHYNKAQLQPRDVLKKPY